MTEAEKYQCLMLVIKKQFEIYKEVNKENIESATDMLTKSFFEGRKAQLSAIENLLKGLCEIYEIKDKQ